MGHSFLSPLEASPMSIKSLRLVTIILAALAMGMHLAHALELPPKLAWEPDLYLAVQVSLYRLFGTLGPFLEIGALLGAALLTARLRQRPAFPFTLASAVAILLSLVVWLLFVLPANGQINAWAATQVAPADWMRWRAQWQIAQAASFGIHLLGFTALVYSVIRETGDG